MKSYEYLGVPLDAKLEWSTNTEAIYQTGLSRLFSLRRLLLNWDLPLNELL